MRSRMPLMSMAIALALTGEASAVTVKQAVTPAWLKDNPKMFSIEAEERDDGLIHFTVTRRLSKPRYLVGHFEVTEDDATVLESHFPAFVRERTATYHLVLSPNYLSGASFVLSEHGFSESDEAPVPWVGGTVYQIRLADFAPEASPQAGR